MKKPEYYSSGEFAKLAQVTVRTIRFYDKQNILKPSWVDENGKRYYTDSDLARLQQILLLKYLGFSLDDIKEMTIDDRDYHFMLSSLKLQKKLVQDKIEQMQLVEQAINNTVEVIEKEHEVDWSQMLNIIHLTGMESTLKSQYQNASNISARIRLHREYSSNKQGWFPWIYEQIGSKDKSILEIGCGNGALWKENINVLPDDVHITLSDISKGMIREVRRDFSGDKRFDFKAFDCHKIPFEDESFDVVIANHVLFYCDNIEKVCKEVYRVLKSGGRFICSAYGEKHMHEITDLVQKFDDRIVLSKNKLFENFGLENGREILSKVFSDVELRRYDDEIVLDTAEPLIEYILSCHGNQGQYILDRYRDFRIFVEKNVGDEYRITKDAGVFVCIK